MAEQEGTRKDAQFIVVSTCPDVCKSPLVPVPYPIVGYFNTTILESPNVRSAGFPVFHMGSRVGTVVGDEAGVGGGVASQVIKGFCKPITPVSNVRVNGQFTNHSDITFMLMNGASPDGPFNTIGQVKFLGVMFFADVGPGGKIPPGANSIVAAENDGEIGCIPKLDSLGGAAGGLGDLVGLAQQTYGLATTDWSNPSAVLGAIGGVAGMAGMGGLAQIAGVAQKAYGAATADWSNPGSALGGLMGIAGPLLAGGATPKANLPPGIVMGGCF